MIAQNIELAIRTAVEKSVGGKEIKNAMQFASKKAVELIRNRTDAGYDIYSKKFPEYTPGYSKFKQRFLSGQTRSGKRRPNKSMQTALREATEFKATKMHGDIRLSGRTFSAIFAKTKPGSLLGKVNPTLQIGINPSREKVVLGLRRKGRDFLGLAVSGKYKAIEAKAIRNAFALGLKKDLRQISLYYDTVKM